MKKGLLAAAVAAVAVGGYFAGVSYTAAQADQSLKDGITQLQEKYGRNAADLVPQSESFAGNSYVLNLDLAAFNPEITRPLLVPVNLISEHGFLNSTTKATLAGSEVRSRLLELVKEEGEEPLEMTVESGFNPFSQGVDIDAELDVAAMAHDDERRDAKFSFAGAELEVSFSGKAFELEMEVQPVKFESPRGGFELEGLKLDEQGEFATTDIFNAVMAERLEAKLKLDKLEVTGRDNIALDDFELTVNQKTRDGRILTDMRNTLDKAVFSNPVSDQKRTFNNLALALHFDFDQKAMLGFVEQLSAMEQPPRHPQMLMGMMAPLTEQGMRLGITELKLTAEDETLEGHINLDLDGFELMQVMRNPLMLRQKLNAEGALSVPKAIAEQLPRGEQRQLQQLAQMGMIKETERSYEAELQIKQGQASLNGQPLPM